MDKILRLYIYVDGGANDTPFPSADNPIEIGAFRYDAKRMGGAPTITASVNYASCLDDEWTYDVYAMFNGEKFYLKQIPTSSYNNTSAMYKHDIELVSERVALDNVYFFDVVSDDIVDPRLVNGRILVVVHRPLEALGLPLVAGNGIPTRIVELAGLEQKMGQRVSAGQGHAPLGVADTGHGFQLGKEEIRVGADHVCLLGIGCPRRRSILFLLCLLVRNGCLIVAVGAVRH